MFDLEVFELEGQLAFGPAAEEVPPLPHARTRTHTHAPNPNPYLLVAKNN